MLDSLSRALSKVLAGLGLSQGLRPEDAAGDETPMHSPCL